MTVYKKEIKETVALSWARILSIHMKANWVEHDKRFNEKESAKIVKYSIITNHYKDIFLESYTLVDLIKIISEWGELLDNEAFMTVYIYGIKMSINSYKAALDYAQMIAEIAEETVVSYDQLDKVTHSCEKIAMLSSKFHLHAEMYNYFFKDNGIEETELFENDLQYGRKRPQELYEFFMGINKSPDIWAPATADVYQKTMEEESKEPSINDPKIHSNLFFDKPQP